MDHRYCMNYLFLVAEQTWRKFMKRPFLELIHEAGHLPCHGKTESAFADVYLPVTPAHA
jgi:hypothetical protein